MPAGRPTIYSEALANKIASYLTVGEPLAKICKRPGMPNYATVRRWEGEKPEFSAILAGAREAGTHFLADDTMRIADDKSLDPAHKRVMIDTRLKLIGMWNRRYYGDKADVNVNHGGAIQINVLPEDKGTL